MNMQEQVVQVQENVQADMQNLYADISERTGGRIYIGVVGPVRTGKSTFIKNFNKRHYRLLWHQPEYILLSFSG